MDTSGIRSAFNTQTGSQGKMRNITAGSAFAEPKDSFQKSEDMDLGLAARVLFRKRGSDISGLNVNWQKKFGERIDGVLLSPDGNTLYAAVDKPSSGSPAALTALDPAAGKERWSYPLESGIKLDAMEITKDGKTVFFSNPRGTMTALDTDGNKPAEKWSFTPENSYADKPVLSPDGKSLLVFCPHKILSEGNVYALNPENGEIKWKTPMNRPVSGPPVFSPDGKQFHIKTVGYGMSTCNIEDGSLKWDKPTFEQSQFPIQTRDGGKTLLSKNYNGEIIGIDASNGDFNIITVIPKSGSQLAGISEKNGMIIMKKSGTELMGISIKDGKEKWMINTEKNSTSPIFSADERELYAVGMDGEIMVIKPQTGTIKGNYHTGDKIYSQMSLSPDGKTLLAGNSSGVIVSVKLENEDGMAESEKTGPDGKSGEIVKNETSVTIGGVKLPLNKKAQEIVI